MDYTLGPTGITLRHDTTREMRRFLPRELHQSTWDAVTDPTALEVGNVVFHSASWAMYHGEVSRINREHRTIEIDWYKTQSDVPVREIFFDYSMHKWKDIWWIDPALE